MKDVAYFYNFKFYDKAVEKGKLGDSNCNSRIKFSGIV